MVEALIIHPLERKIGRWLWNPCRGKGNGKKGKMINKRTWSKLAQLPFPGNGARKLVGILNANREIRKRMDTDVAFAREYSRVPIFHKDRDVY